VVVPVGDADALAAALASVIDHDDRRTELVSAGRRQVGRFTWDRTAAGLHALYLDAANDRPGVRRR
jgi:glycosyltransferase involved in cell wall biosynthesis